MTEEKDISKVNPIIIRNLPLWGIQTLINRVIVNKKDGSILIKIPAGEFEMGDGKENDCPKHKVFLDSYYIGVYCITNRQYKQFVEETGHRPPDKADYGTPVWKGNSYPSEYADHPVVCVSWDDAAAYCKWAGLYLPTEAQWERAARGPKNLLYPWGNKYDKNRCRNKNNKGSGTTCRVYDYPEGVSGYGLYNMAGNVWKWCRDWYDDDYYKESPGRNPVGPVTGYGRVDRGGSWDDSDAVRFRGADWVNGDPSRRGDDRSFCVALPAG